jgi:hypothetical protein
MKKIIFALSLLLVFSTMTFAQCGKKIIITSSKTENLDASGTVEKTIEEKTIIEINKSDLTVTPGEDRVMTGAIKSDSCNWKVPFKEGKSIIKATLADDGGDAKNVTITIEGKDGKITFLAEVEEMPDRKIRLVIDKFEEKK